MRHCPKCGAACEETHRFCPQCASVLASEAGPALSGTGSPLSLGDSPTIPPAPEGMIARGAHLVSLGDNATAAVEAALAGTVLPVRHSRLDLP